MTAYIDNPQSYRVSADALDSVLRELKTSYKIYAPKRFETRDADDQDMIRYGEIDSIRETVFDAQSAFSPKEIYYPVTQTMFYFTDNTCTENAGNDGKGIIIFARPCDINAINRLDAIFLENGGKADVYYERLRGKVKFIMMECRESMENCFCVSMGANRTEDYCAAIRADCQSADNFDMRIKDAELLAYFSGEKQSGFIPEFPAANQLKVTVPVIDSRESLARISSLEFWKEYDDKCIGCGGCNMVCGTCSCFDTVDVIYTETARDGERRRVWSSCMLDTFTLTASGRARKTPGDNMRFKTLHKIYDYQKRFGGENMCVGCGRCDRRCPADISFAQTINRLSKV